MNFCLKADNENYCCAPVKTVQEQCEYYLARETESDVTYNQFACAYKAGQDKCTASTIIANTEHVFVKIKSLETLQFTNTNLDNKILNLGKKADLLYKIIVQTVRIIHEDNR